MHRRQGSTLNLTGATGRVEWRMPKTEKGCVAELTHVVVRLRAGSCVVPLDACVVRGQQNLHQLAAPRAGTPNETEREANAITILSARTRRCRGKLTACVASAGAGGGIRARPLLFASRGGVLSPRRWAVARPVADWSIAHRQCFTDQDRRNRCEGAPVRIAA